MDYRDMGEGFFILKARPGEEIISALTAFVNEKKIYAGFLTGIGAAQEAELGYFDSQKKAYSRKTLTEPLEIVSLTANISRVEDGQAFIHAHAVLSLRDMSARAGHLFRAVADPTCEIYLHALPGVVERRMVPESGLKLWKI
jgi:hypothetical protein